ncbi:MAG: MlaD family protein [Myxococcota bacterium]|nr:MlaD family protein [Myxococcota bacterium]
MMSNLRVGLMVLLGIGSVGTFQFYLNQSDAAPESSYILYAVFEDASGLSLASRVRIAGIDVGHIDKVELEGAKARLTLRMRKDLKIYKDSKVSKRPEGILGTNNIHIVPGTPASGMLESGSDITNVSDSDVLESMTETLSKTATDIQALSEEIRILAKSVRQFVVGKKGQEAPLERLTNMMISEVDNLSGSARQLLSSMTRLVDGNASEFNATVNALRTVAENLEGLSSAQTGSVEQILTNVAGATKALNRILGEVESLAGSEGGEVKGLAAQLRASVESLSNASAEVEKVAQMAAGGKGMVGRLISDEDLGLEVDSAIRGVSQMVATYDKLRTEVEMSGGWRSVSNTGRAGLRVNLLTRKDKGYILELNSDDRVSPLEQQRTVGDVTTITETIEDEFRLSAQFWHRFGMVGLRAGLIDSRGGVGLDAYLLDDRLRIQLDAFDFDRQIADIALAPRHRALVDIKVLKHLYLVAGVEDPIFADQRDFYFGAGVRFFDPDLKSVLAVAPSP